MKGVTYLQSGVVLTISRRTDDGEIELKIPNLAIRGCMLIKFVKCCFLNLLKEMPEKLRQSNYIKQVISNSDYKRANELTVKTAFLTLLYNDILYIMDTETELDRRYADLTMIIRPDMRRFTVLDILIEFQFVKLKDSGMSGEQARKLTREELENMALMKARVEDAKIQVKDYGYIL